MYRFLCHNAFATDWYSSRSDKVKVNLPVTADIFAIIAALLPCPYLLCILEPFLITSCSFILTLLEVCGLFCSSTLSDSTLSFVCNLHMKIATV